MPKHTLGRELHKRTRTPNLIFLFSVVFNIPVDHTLVVFELERMAQHSWQDDKWSDQRCSIAVTSGVKPSLRKLKVFDFKKSSQQLFSTRPTRSERHPVFFLLVASLRAVRRNSLNATVSVHRIHFLERAQHSFSREHMTAHSVAQD